MQIILHIARRELQSFFHTTIGWLCLVGFIGLSGLIFAWIATAYADPTYALQGQPIDVNEYLIPDFFGTISVFLLMLAPALSMRAFSEDLQQGSFELLLSSPILSSQIVWGKFLGILGFLGILLLSTSHIVVLLYWISSPSPVMLGLNYLSTFLMSASFVAIGLLFSSWTRSQLIALALGFGFLLALWFLGGLAEMAEGTTKDVLSYISILNHTDNLNKGLLYSKDIIYFLSTIFIFLFATQQRIEAYRW